MVSLRARAILTRNGNHPTLLQLLKLFEEFALKVAQTFLFHTSIIIKKFQIKIWIFDNWVLIAIS